jgi:hypothetical protein
MSEENWISSKEAVLRVRRAGWTEGDLAHWAENGQLRSRAARLQSSDDDDLLERELALPSDAKELQRELKKRALSGSPWPDIPADFWYWFNRYSQSREAQWAAGVFSTKVHFETQLGPHEGSLTIRLLDVTFCAEDLAELLGEISSPKLRGTLPNNAKRAHRKVEEQAHRAAEIIREDRVSLAEAIRTVAGLAEFPKPPDIQPESYEMSIRRSYDLMYNKKGNPI